MNAIRRSIALAVLALAFAPYAWAQTVPAALLPTLKATINADPSLASLPLTSGAASTIAAALNQTASPPFLVYRTRVTKSEFVSVVSATGTTWSWPAYIARTAGERDGWREMFSADGAVDCSQANVRQGFQDVFSGASNSAPAQRQHLQATCLRAVSRAEKAFATGAGTQGSPGTLQWEGTLSSQDVQSARELP